MFKKKRQKKIEDIFEKKNTEKRIRGKCRISGQIERKPTNIKIKQKQNKNKPMKDVPLFTTKTKHKSNN